MALLTRILYIFLGITIVYLVLSLTPKIVIAASQIISGQAKILNTNNSYWDFTNYNSNVMLDDVTGDLSGYAFLEDLGWVALGTTDNASGPVNVNMTTGEVTGIAKVLNTDNEIDFSAYNSNVVLDLNAETFSGYVFSEDVGWINFGDVGVIIGPGSPSPPPTPTPIPDVGSPSAVATFNSLGITWTPPSASSANEATVQFRESGTSTWLEGYPLWYSSADDLYRGSLVHLKPGTEYEIYMELDGLTEHATLIAETWSEDFPIASTVYLPENSSDTLTITSSGTANGYILYTHAPGSTATIDVANLERNNIVIDAAYIIIRGLTLKGAQKDAIHIYPTDSHDIVIEDNDISDWSSVKYVDTNFGQDSEAAIRANTSPNVSRIIIQRNTIHNPRADTNSWGETRDDVTPTSSGTHPSGPQAVYLYQSGGNHVIRYNTIYSDTDHRFNDCIGGGQNSSTRGFPYEDSDIYGNYISHCWDNGIEVEGGNENVRVWGNYIDETYRPIANRDTRTGPLYVWRNVTNKTRKYPEDLYTWAQDPHGSLGKTGGESATENGVFYFHNTALQPSVPGESITGGIAWGLDGPMQYTTTRNNILHTYCTDSTCDAIKLTGGAVTNDFNYDLFNKNVSISGAETNGFFGVPTYTTNFYFNPYTFVGNFSLASHSLGYDTGLVIPNFNSHIAIGGGPDVGAHETGMPEMEFGTTAYLSNDPYTISSSPSTSTSSPSSSGNNSDSSVCNSVTPNASPDLFQINSLSSTSVRMYFTPITNNADRYFVSYSTNPNAEEHGFEFLNNSKAVIAVDVKLLKPNTVYYFKIRAGNGCMPGPWSNILSVKPGQRFPSYRWSSFPKIVANAVRKIVKADPIPVGETTIQPTAGKQPPTPKPTSPITTAPPMPSTENANQSVFSKVLNFFKGIFN